MENSDTSEPEQPHDAVLVEATLEQLRLAAEKVLFEFTEEYESRSGEKVEAHDDLFVGDTIIFEEEMDHMPAQIVAIKISDTFWYIISTSETPESGYPTTKDAVRAGQAEEKKLRIFVDFISGQECTKVIDDIRTWKPDMRAEASDWLSLISKSRKKWSH